MMLKIKKKDMMKYYKTVKGKIRALTIPLGMQYQRAIFHTGKIAPEQEKSLKIDGSRNLKL